MRRLSPSKRSRTSRPSSKTSKALRDRPPERPNALLSGALSLDAVAERLFAHPEAAASMPIGSTAGPLKVHMPCIA